jgi:hypothetical protein
LDAFCANNAYDADIAKEAVPTLIEDVCEFLTNNVVSTFAFNA